MTRALALAGLLALAAGPALACHRFAVWRYPWAQRCGFVLVRTAPARATSISSGAPDDRTWYVEITRLPDDIDARAIGIEALRRALK